MRRPFSGNSFMTKFARGVRQHSFPAYGLAYILARDLESRYLTHKFSKETKIETISNLNFNNLKKSDTLFILGTGSSVNKYSNENWSMIDKGDSVGVNYWAIHDYVPDFYTFELPRNQDDRDALYHILQTRSDEYQETTFLLKDIPTLSSDLEPERLPDSILNNLYISCETPIPWDKEKLPTFRKGCEILDTLGYFSQDKITTIPYKGASIIYLISLGINMRYNNIVLCGVDLSNPEHFYTENSKFYLDRSIPVKKQSVDREVHKTISPTEKSITVVEIIDQLKNSILKKKGIELYIGSQESALYPTLPYFFSRS